jgi:hypothetical protein
VPSRFTPPVSPTPIRSRRHRSGIAQHYVWAGRMSALNLITYSKLDAISPFRHANSGRLHSRVCELCSAPSLLKENYGDNQRSRYKLPASKAVSKYTCDHQLDLLPSVSSEVTCLSIRRTNLQNASDPMKDLATPSRFLTTCFSQNGFLIKSTGRRTMHACYQQ